MPTQRSVKKAEHRRGVYPPPNPATYPKRLRFGDAPGTYGVHERTMLPSKLDECSNRKEQHA